MNMALSTDPPLPSLDILELWHVLYSLPVKHFLKKTPTYILTRLFLGWLFITILLSPHPPSPETFSRPVSPEKCCTRLLLNVMNVFDRSGESLFAQILLVMELSLFVLMKQAKMIYPMHAVSEGHRLGNVPTSQTCSFVVIDIHSWRL